VSYWGDPGEIETIHVCPTLGCSYKSKSPWSVEVPYNQTCLWTSKFWAFYTSAQKASTKLILNNILWCKNYYLWLQIHKINLRQNKNLELKNMHKNCTSHRAPPPSPTTYSYTAILCLNWQWRHILFQWKPCDISIFWPFLKENL